MYIIGERALRENAGTSWGSSPVASVVRAETNVPPAFGVCAKRVAGQRERAEREAAGLEELASGQVGSRSDWSVL